ncbi:MAG: hypothetical protein LBJ33_10480 [Pseudomonas putida]|jgi:major type 1 subunit fimbrin (pilin)|nr:hypothetical protein [Pseudomonas putida]
MSHGNSSLGKLALGVAAILLGKVELAQAICFGDPTRLISYSGPENLTILRDVPDGTLLYSETKTLPKSNFECTSQELWGLDLAFGRGPSPTSKTIDFPIGVSGLSFRIKVGLGSGMGYLASLDPLKWGAYYLRDEMILEIYKRGALAPSGVVRAGDLGVVKFGSQNIANIALGLNINVVALSCESPDVNVAMGDDYKLVDFGDPGSTTRAVPFNIMLNNCPSESLKSITNCRRLLP